MKRCRPLEQIEAVFKTNVVGVLATTRAFYPLLLKSTAERKLIINTGSTLGSIAFHLTGLAKPEIDPRTTYMGGYVISKAAVNMRALFSGFFGFFWNQPWVR